MTIKVLKIDQYKLGLIMGILFGGLSLLIWPIFLITFSFQEINPFQEEPFVQVLFLILPIVYFAFGAIGTIIMFSLFNFVSRKLKGIDVEIEGSVIKEGNVQ